MPISGSGWYALRVSGDIGAIERLLRAHHVPGLSPTSQRAALACQLQLQPAELAPLLVVSENTARGQIARAEVAVFAGLPLSPGRALLGRWAAYHRPCCLPTAEEGPLAPILRLRMDHPDPPSARRPL
jgi:hypothetical protein